MSRAYMDPMGYRIAQFQRENGGYSWESTRSLVCSLNLPPEMSYTTQLVGTWWYKFRVLTQMVPHIFQLTIGKKDTKYTSISRCSVWLIHVNG